MKWYYLFQIIFCTKRFSQFLYAGMSNLHTFEKFLKEEKIKIKAKKGCEKS